MLEHCHHHLLLYQIPLPLSSLLEIGIRGNLKQSLSGSLTVSPVTAMTVPYTRQNSRKTELLLFLQWKILATSRRVSSLRECLKVWQNTIAPTSRKYPAGLAILQHQRGQTSVIHWNARSKPRTARRRLSRYWRQGSFFKCLSGDEGSRTAVARIPDRAKRCSTIPSKPHEYRENPS